MIEGLVFEGHVLIADMQRVLRERAREVTGLAVAGLLIGSPGMEILGKRRQSYDVIAFGSTGTRVYAHHGS